MQTLLQDLRFGARMLAKRPLFSSIAALTLALGIGSATTIFSSLDAMLLRPFSFPNQSRLVQIFERKASIGVAHASVSPANVVDWREHSQTFEDVIVMRNRDFTLSGDGPPERYASYGVSVGFFDALGIKPMLGRTFEPGEDHAGRENVAVLRYGFWQSRFGADPHIIGRRILLDEKPFTIIGVMPEDFNFPYGAGEMWTPFVIDPQMERDHSGHYLSVLALLKPGITVAQADADLLQMSKRIEQQFPNGEAGHEAYAVSLIEWYTRGIRVAVPAMIGSAICVLLIACANVANLFLARSAARQKEVAVRLAIGATRWRVLRQLLTESVMLAFVAAGLGVLIALWEIAALSKGIPSDIARSIPGLRQLGLNYRVLGFTALVAIITGVLFGLAPAWQAARTDLNEALKEAGATGSTRRGGLWTRQSLVVAEIALSVVLLVGAGLTVRSTANIARSDIGVKPDNVITMRIALPRDKYGSAEQRRDFFEQLLQRAAAIPGVVQIGGAHSLPLSGRNDGNTFQIAGQPTFEKGKEPHTDYRIVTPGYFAAIGTDVRRGRSFTSQDDGQSQRVAVINEAFESRFLQGSNPIGQRITIGDEKDKSMEIVGVAANVINDDLDDMTEPCVYLPFAQGPVGGLSVVIRASGSPEQLVPAVREKVAELDPGLPLTEVKTLEQVVYERRSTKELMMWMLVVFGLLALALAAVGTYGVTSYSVTQRTRELGVRIAIGAQPAHILKLILGRGALVTLVGVGLGLAGSFATTRVLAQFLFGVTATDGFTFAGVALLLAAVAMTASYIPARRATKVDPTVALRYE